MLPGHLQLTGRRQRVCRCTAGSCGRLRAAAARTAGRRKGEGVHAMLSSSREDQDPEGPLEGTVLNDLGLANPAMLTASPPLAGGRPGGPELRRSDSSRSTASRMSSKSPPRGRYVVLPTPSEASSNTTWDTTDNAEAVRNHVVRACLLPQVVCMEGHASCHMMGFRNMVWGACRPSLALSSASERQSAISLCTTYGAGLPRMSFEPRGPGASETQPC